MLKTGMRLLLLTIALAPLLAQDTAPLRPPAPRAPLIVHDPYFSVWSMADRVTEQATKHWTGTDQALTGLVRIDGKVRRFMGNARVDALPQTAQKLTPTRTLYSFAGDGIALDVTFLTPALAGDMETLSRPLTYMLFDVRSTDAKPHRVRIYFDASSQLVVDTAAQRAMWSRHRLGDLEVVRVGSIDQRMLTRSGDNLRIDWGYFYLAAPSPAITLGTTTRQRGQYLATLDLPGIARSGNTGVPRHELAVAAVAMDLDVPSSGTVSRYLMACL